MKAPNVKPKNPTFKKGQSVTWKSQASGFVKKKTGKIVEVLKPGEYPERNYGKSLFQRAAYDRILYQGAGNRPHKSYVVDVKGKLYWPLVKNLRSMS